MEDEKKVEDLEEIEPKLEDIDPKYFDKRERSRLFNMVIPYFHHHKGSYKFDEDAPQEIEEAFHEWLKYLEAERVYKRETGEDIH